MAQFNSNDKDISSWFLWKQESPSLFDEEQEDSFEKTTTKKNRGR